MKGSVYKRPNGWEYRFDLGPDPLTGKRRTTSKGGFATRKEAEKAMREAMSAHEKGRHVSPSRRTVGQFLDEWHAAIEPSLRRTTWVNYRNYKDAYVKPVVGDTALQDLTPVRVNLLYTHLLGKGRVHRREGQGPGLSRATVVSVHIMLHRALRDAVKWDYLARNPVEFAERPKQGRRAPTVWTPEQLRAFVAHVRGDRFFALYLLVITTGARRGALVGLRRDDVDLDAGTISPSVPRVVVDGKADDGEQKSDGAYRPTALDPVTLGALREHVKRWEEERELFGHDTQLLFGWPDGRHVHPDTVTDWFQKHAKAAGLPVIRLHDVRHSYATAAIKSGVHVKVVSERLGHADVATTLKIYAHVLPGMDKAAADEIADLILGPPETHTDPDVRGSVRTDAPSPLDTPADEANDEGRED